jgi:hypothetical protein
MASAQSAALHGLSGAMPVRKQKRYGAELENKGQDLACARDIPPIPKYLERALQRSHVRRVAYPRHHGRGHEGECKAGD